MTRSRSRLDRLHNTAGDLPAVDDMTIVAVTLNSMLIIFFLLFCPLGILLHYVCIQYLRVLSFELVCWPVFTHPNPITISLNRYNTCKVISTVKKNIIKHC